MNAAEYLEHLKNIKARKIDWEEFDKKIDLINKEIKEFEERKKMWQTFSPDFFTRRFTI